MEYYIFLYFSRGMSRCHVGVTLAIMSPQLSQMAVMSPTQTPQLLHLLMERHHLKDLNTSFTPWLRYRQL